MEIKINRCIEGAKAAEGITVVIDVFRASNTIVTLLSGGAACILPIGGLEEAFRLKKENPNQLLFGERGGLPPDGFDFGNSPVQTTNLDVKGKEVILTTSAGSQGIVNAKNADEILIGCFINAQSIVTYLKAKNPKTVTLLAIGNNAIESATEDEECAKYIKSQLEGIPVNLDFVREVILKSKGADRLRRLNQEDDLEFCMQLDTYNVLPRFDQKSEKITNLLECI